MNTSLSDWSSHHTVAEDSVVLECYSASGKWFVTLQRIVVPSPWSEAVCLTLMRNALHSIKASVTASLKTGIFMNNSNFTQRSWFVLWLFLHPYRCEKEGSWLAWNEQFVTAATFERNRTVGALRRKMGKPVVLLWTSRLLVSGWDNIKDPILWPSMCAVNLCTTEICNKNGCCYSP